MAKNMKMSLLEKYNLQIDQLDYKFIGTCKDIKTLERILIVLRSGQEGVYPDLIKFCENKLRELAPKSRLLHLTTKIKRYGDLSEDERKDIENELENWYIDTEDKETNKDRPIQENKNMPSVRGKSIKIETVRKKDKISPPGKPEKKPCSQKSYSEWDKFDVEKELKKLDESESNDFSNPPSDNKNKVNKDSELEQLVFVSDLTEKERQHVADIEKNKGNEAFKAHDYEEAILYYTRSLSAYKSIVTLNNRAQAYIKMKNYFSAIQDCNKILLTESNNLKALYRRGLALKESGMYDLAELDFRALLELDAENKSAKEQLRQIKQLKVGKPESKNVMIEEIKSEETETQKFEMGQEKNSVKCTRMKIEEVTTTDNTEKLTHIHYESSEEDDNSSHLSVKVKEMFQINKPSTIQKDQLNKMIDGIEIEKTSIREIKQNKHKMNVIEEYEPSTVISNNIDKNKCKTNLSAQDKTKSDAKFIRIAIEDSATNTEYSKQSHRCSPENKPLNNISSVVKKVDFKLTEENTNSVLLENNENHIPFTKKVSDEIDILKPIKYQATLEISSTTDFNSDKNVANQEEKVKDKIKLCPISEDDNKKSDGHNIYVKDYKKSNSEGKNRHYLDSNIGKNITAEDFVSNQNILLKSESLENDDKECKTLHFNSQSTKDDKICEMQNFKELFDESNKSGINKDYFQLDEFGEFNSEKLNNVKEENTETIRSELPSENDEYIGKGVTKSQHKEANYFTVNNSEEEITSGILSSTKEMVHNNEFHDTFHKICSSKDDNISDLMNNNIKSICLNGIQTHQKELHNYSNAKSGSQVDQDTADYGVSIFTAQSIIKDNNFETQDLAYEKSENYNGNNLELFKSLKKERKDKESIYNYTEENNGSGTCETYNEKSFKEPEDEFIDVVNDYSLQETGIEKHQNTVKEYEMNHTNLRCKITNEDCKSAANSLNKLNLLEERIQSNDYFSNDNKKNYVRFNETLNESRTEESVKDVKVSKSPVLENDTQYEKVSPYEFLCTWCLNDDKDIESRALNLLKFKPEELPLIISNKIDASMLIGILKAISFINKTGRYAETEKYLCYLTQVPRINIAAMFLTNEEVKSILDLFTAADYEHEFHMQYINRILQMP